jgi:hypothetical protein
VKTGAFFLLLAHLVVLQKLLKQKTAQIKLRRKMDKIT